MQRRVRAGVIGVGRMGEYHCGAYTEIHYVDLVGVADTNEERLKVISERYDVPGYTDYRELLDKVDVVSVAVPTAFHYEVATECMRRGVHVLVEKPIAYSLEEAERMFEIAKENKVVLCVGHVERFNGAVQELMNIVENPLLIESRRLGPFSPRVASDSVVLDLMIHDIDIVLRLARSEVSEIDATGLSYYTDRCDAATVQIRFESGCIATLTASRVTQHKIRTMAVSERDFYVFLNFTEQDLHIHRQAYSEAVRLKDQLRYKQSSIIEQVFVHKGNPLKLELMHFIDLAFGNGDRIVSVDDELRSLKVALEVERILKEKGVIKAA
ncbi:oxidoreductase [Thermosulfidibacter takaii ABI70S6]|uniref:Oxidoreductase n=1 Tax=Thermosulfidibacter takaii (strain DSM 17441 / JCM 13301 / NBRC 103674 / ABI70S6) TaxID=1298851 RepID=A0A0S3QTQ0_THET7|nr:Gfo/Idh/MocA family oxidoreductase [Thermosulfidibacter takaii]BAT71716.1 oxidoreductase [Thermosulfidibacter takaii ABI70S6]